MRQLKGLVALGLALSLSVSSSLVSFAANYSFRDVCYDDETGLISYMIYGEEIYGFADLNHNIVIPAKWEKVEPFVGGYAIVHDHIPYGSGILSYNFSAINKSGEIIKSWSFGINKSLPGLYRFQKNSEGYIWYLCEPTRQGMVYWYGDNSSEQNQVKIFENMKSVSITDTDFVREWIDYEIGPFRDGTANVYKVNIRVEGARGAAWGMNRKVTPTAIGSITPNGTFSTKINSKSEYGKYDRIPAEGVNQFAASGTNVLNSNSSLSGWKQDSAGWWYVNSDGSCTKNGWQNIDGKDYYFDTNGYMLHDTTTPDGYAVGADGAWIK